MADPVSEAAKVPGTTPVVESVPGIRIFDDASIHAAVSKALASVPEGKAGAVVAYVDQSKDVKLAVAARVGDHWSIALQAEKPYHKSIKGMAAVVFAW